MELPANANFEPYCPKVNVDSKAVIAYHSSVVAVKDLLNKILATPVESRISILKPGVCVCLCGHACACFVCVHELMNACMYWWIMYLYIFCKTFLHVVTNIADFERDVLGKGENVLLTRYTLLMSIHNHQL